MGAQQHSQLFPKARGRRCYPWGIRNGSGVLDCGASWPFIERVRAGCLGRGASMDHAVTSQRVILDLFLLNNEVCKFHRIALSSLQDANQEFDNSFNDRKF